MQNKCISKILLSLDITVITSITQYKKLSAIKFPIEMKGNNLKFEIVNYFRMISVSCRKNYFHCN